MAEYKFDAKTEYYLKADELPLMEFISQKNSLGSLQLSLHDLTYSFLNGGFSMQGFALYPLVKGVSEENKKKCIDVFSTVKSLRSKGMVFQNFAEFEEFTSKNVALMISGLYRDIGALAKKEGRIKKTVKVTKIGEYKEDMKYLAPLFGLRNFINSNLLNDIIDFHVHGSIATKDYVKGYSDLDTLIILKKGAITPQNLIRLRNLLYQSRKYLCMVDALQHHGHMLITEYDMEYYCEGFFPLELFRYSKSIIGEKSLSFCVRSSKYEEIARLFWFVNYFRHQKMHCRKLGSYDLKFLLHAIALFPALYLQAKGKPTYKKYSFDIAKRDFSPELWKPVDEMTYIRDNWRSPVKLPLPMFNPVLSCQVNARYWDLMGKFREIDSKKLVSGMHLLSESAWEGIKQGLRKEASHN